MRYLKCRVGPSSGAWPRRTNPIISAEIGPTCRPFSSLLLFQQVSHQMNANILLWALMLSWQTTVPHVLKQTNGERWNIKNPSAGQVCHNNNVYLYWKQDGVTLLYQRLLVHHASMWFPLTTIYVLVVQARLLSLWQLCRPAYTLLPNRFQQVLHQMKAKIIFCYDDKWQPSKF